MSKYKTAAELEAAREALVKETFEYNAPINELMRAAEKADIWCEIRPVIREVRLFGDPEEEVIAHRIVKVTFVIGDEVVGTVWPTWSGYAYKPEPGFELKGKHVPHPVGRRYRFGEGKRRYKRVDTAIKFMAEHFRADNPGERLYDEWMKDDIRKDFENRIRECKYEVDNLVSKLKESALLDALYFDNHGEMTALYASRAVEIARWTDERVRYKEEFDKYREGFVLKFNADNGTDFKDV